MISLRNYVVAQDALTSHHATTFGADMAARFDTVSPDSILS